MESHLLQMRGLKLYVFFSDISTYSVASFTDAWIETMYIELKEGTCMSHLLQMRGLKLYLLISLYVILVASFTDAWIETFSYIKL